MEGAMEESKRKANGERRGKRKRANSKVFGGWIDGEIGEVERREAAAQT